MSNPLLMLRDGLLRHLVALGFLLFALVGVVWRVELFGVTAPPVVSPAAPVEMKGGRPPTGHGLSRPASAEPSIAGSEPDEPVSAPTENDPEAPAPAESLPPVSPSVQAPESGSADSSKTLETPAVQQGAEDPGTLEEPQVADSGGFRPLTETPAETATPTETRVLAPSQATARPPGHSQFVPVEALRPPQPPPRTGLPTDPVDVAGLLEEARKAYWNGALRSAESLYLRYLALRPENPMAFGELGNLYRDLGRIPDAMDAYFEAAIRFKSIGDHEHVARIREFFEQAGDPRVEQLRSH